MIDHVTLTTVGIDVGSTTSHLMFGRLQLERERENLSSRFVVTDRRELYRSPIALTPYRPDGAIDKNGLTDLFDQGYGEAGFDPDEIDSGAVILTGLARERVNARAIAELFAKEGGKFVCACAGHNLEARLAAHGSGAVALSAQQHSTVLNIDIGGGTTKLALVKNGDVVATLILSIGARLVRFHEDGSLAAIDSSAHRLESARKMSLRPGEIISQDECQSLANEMVGTLVEVIRGTTINAHLHVEGSLPQPMKADIITFSGGVSEFIYERIEGDFGDLGTHLGSQLRASIKQLGIQVHEPREGIRASVLGASQFSLQVSGNTIFMSDPTVLPLHNVPVIRIELGESPVDAMAVAGHVQEGIAAQDLTTSVDPVAIALRWEREPLYSDLLALATGIYRAHVTAARSRTLLIIALEGDLGATVGRILTSDVDANVDILALDSIELLDLDYIDVGEMLSAEVVPVVVKSLLFSNPTA
ncbi:MAG: reactivating factor for ethanolamine ammonia lyase [Actinobacteria bacterium]|nr:reactivating factor for ethanolamine ammonia lyase [Actinomycetota bacterium]